ncbi:MAG: glycosyl transferase family 2, partial [Bacteroidetes bacterium SW_11_45_7]
MVRLSIIIVNYNVKYFLEQALHSVRNATKTINAEVIVVDNCSSDGSQEIVQQKFPEVQLIANRTNRGFASANNQGIKASKGEYVLLLNPDTVVEEDTFEKTLAFMDDHPDAGALGVKMLDGRGNFLPESKRAFPTPAVSFYKIFGLSALFPHSRVFSRYHLGYLDNDTTQEVEVLAGAFMLIRRKVLEEVGSLDETYFMYGEDIDLSYRIQQAGYKNYYFPGTRIIHYKGESTKKGSLNYVRMFYNAMIIFARKHFSSGKATLYSNLIKAAITFRAA